MALVISDSEHPSLRLATALNGLVTCGYNLNLFRRLAEGRDRKHKAIVAMANVLGRTDPDGAVRLVTRPIEDVMAPEFFATLREELDRWEAMIAIAVNAIRGGGAQPLDDALSPGTSKQAVSAHVRLQRATSVIAGLRGGLTLPQAVLEPPISAWEEFCKWCGETRDQIWAAAELRGLPQVRHCEATSPLQESRGQPSVSAPNVENRLATAASTPELTADHEAVLKVWAGMPTRCRTVGSVASVGPIRNRETVGRLLRELARFNLVHRPYGMKKGYVPTDAGRAVLARGDPAT